MPFPYPDYKEYVPMPEYDSRNLPPYIPLAQCAVCYHVLYVPDVLPGLPVYAGMPIAMTGCCCPEYAYAPIGSLPRRTYPEKSSN
jgi:hypothetical protein